MKTAVAVIALLAFVLPLNAQPADSPWPMFQRDIRHSGRSDYPCPSGPHLSWSYLTNGQVSSSPAIGSDGRVYVSPYESQCLYVFTSEGCLS